MKDYYLILELDVSATRQDIKKAYRKLALKYHPDKNVTDHNASAKFAEIKEAYEVLTDPTKKEYYLEQRWLRQAMGKKTAGSFTTPVSILKQALEFDRHVSKLDVHRMNKDGLYQYIMDELLPPASIEKLNSFNDEQVNQEIVSIVLKNLFVVPAQHLKNLETRVLSIKIDALTRAKTESGFLEFQKTHYFEKHRIWIMLLLVGIISLLIFFAAR